jgi:hypothetical protein
MRRHRLTPLNHTRTPALLHRNNTIRIRLSVFLASHQFWGQSLASHYIVYQRIGCVVAPQNNYHGFLTPLFPGCLAAFLLPGSNAGTETWFKTKRLPDLNC